MDYEPRDYPAVAVTVDLVLLTIRDGLLHTLCVKRGLPPFKGRWALPGGFIHPDETLDQAAARELREETGMTRGFHLEQLASYGSPTRDPRMRVVTVAYLALAADPANPRPGSDADEAQWRPVASLGGRNALAFDHGQILADGVERARAKIEYSPAAAAFCPTAFTVNELRRVYETLWDRPVDPRNFHRKVTRAVGFLVPTGDTTTRDGGRPAQLYTRGKIAALYPPLLRALP